MTVPATLEKKIRLLSRRPAGDALRDTRRGGVATEPSSGETIVLSIASERLDQAFDEAQRQLGKTTGLVRMIAHGATLERTWPSFARSEPRIVLTEPGAFHHLPLEASTDALRTDFRAWLDRVFGPAFDGRAGDILYGSACARFFQTPIVTFPIARALAQAFSNVTFVSLDASNHTDVGGWDPQLFASIVSRTGNRVELPFAPPPPSSAWTARVAMKGVIALGGAVTWQARDFWRTRRTPKAAIVDQVTMPDRTTTFARALLQGSLSSAKVLARLATDPKMSAAGESIGLEPHLWPLMSLATLDVLRGVLAERAAGEVAKRHDTLSSAIVLTGPSTVSTAAANLALRRAGLTTVDKTSSAPSASSSSNVPTSSTMPVRWRLPPRSRLGARNILLVNRHGHPDLVGDGVFRDRVFQEEFLDVGRRLFDRKDRELAFRWRPHPATVDEAIAHGRTFFPEAELSRDRSLEADAAWADIIVGSWSMAIFESLFASVPVFIQARSEMIGLPVLETFAHDRVFWTTSEGVDKVLATLSAIERGAPDVLAPERQARDAFFGPGALLEERGSDRTTPRPASDRTQ